MRKFFTSMSYKINRDFDIKTLTLVSIFALAFLLRVFFLFKYSTPLLGDQLEYDRLATLILEGKGYLTVAGLPTAARPPGYSLFLAMMTLITGEKYLIVKVIQIIVDSFSCLLIYHLGETLMDRNVAVVAALISAVHLGFIAQPAKVLTECLTVFLFLSTVIFYSKSRRDFRSYKYYILTGVFLALTTYFRSNLAIVFIFLCPAFCYDLIKKGLPIKKVIIATSVFIISFWIILSPWVVRNYKVFNKFVPLSTQRGAAIYAANKPINGKIYGFFPEDEVTRRANLLSSESEISDFYYSEAMKRYKESPSLLFKYIPLKLAYFSSPVDWELISSKVGTGVSTSSGAVFNYSFAFYFPFFLFGIIKLRSKFNEFLPIYIPVISIVFTTIVLFCIPRFRVPFEPYMIIFASFGICYLYEKVKIKKIYLSVLSLYFVLNIFLYLNSDLIKTAIKSTLKSKGLW